MNKLKIFHISIIAFIVVSLIANNMSEDSIAQVIINFFLAIFTFSYVISIAVIMCEKKVF